MKKFLMMFAAMAFTMSAFAEDYTLYYESATEGGNVEVSAVAKLQKLVFKNGVLAVTFKDGTTQTTNLSAVKRLFFATPATGVESVEAEDAENVKVEGAVYDLMGRKVSENFGDNLPKGMYIVGGKKVLVK
jgi:hypothetical protein